MKLKDKRDKAYFLVDIGRLDLLETLRDDEEIPTELFESFIKKRKPLITGLMNFKQSNLTKQQWRSSRFKFLRGIRRFHRSLEGKRMHRALGRFLATRILRPHLSTLRERYESLDALQYEALKAISSYKTHAYIEEEYYSPLSEAEEYFSFMNYAIPILTEIEMKLYADSNTDISEDGYELLLRIIDEKEFCKSISEMLGLSLSCDRILEVYKAVQGNMISSGSSIDETYFFSRHMENVILHLLEDIKSQ